MHRTGGISMFTQRRPYWLPRREAALNWLALGLLLAAWNAADDDSGFAARRPDSLRAHHFVSARAARRVNIYSP
jgi:hypothetical protein